MDIYKQPYKGFLDHNNQNIANITYPSLVLKIGLPSLGY